MDNKYKMLQLSAETHKLLKEYCQKHHIIMGRFVESLIKKSIKPS